MKLYHFRDQKYGLKSIQEKRLKIARINELNDPFELIGVELSNKTQRKKYKSLKKIHHQTRGLLCFSKYWNNPVQWAHYSDNHTGLCMGFEIPDEMVVEVDYVEKRIDYPKNYQEGFLLKTLSTKFEHWKYENEYRLILTLNEHVNENDLYFKNFSESLKLKQIIVGCNSSITRSEVVQTIENYNYDIDVFKSRPAFKNFEIVRNKNEKLWA